MKHLATTILTLFVISATSAQKNKKVDGNGNTVTVERTTSDYDQIAISGFFDIELVDGHEGKLTLTGEENILAHIITETEGDKLVIKVEKGYYLKPSLWKKGIFISIPIESIDVLSLSGSGDIVGKKTIKTSNFEANMSGSGDISLRLEASSIKANMSGSGDMVLSGQTIDLNVAISGSGDINAYELAADNVDAAVSGSANIEVTANKKINARVSGSGDIDYRGNPEKVISKVSGSGDITKH